MRTSTVFVALAISFLFQILPLAAEDRAASTPTDLILTSSAFQDQGEILATFTCDAENVSPPLQWRNAPRGSNSFALIVDDPDAPKGTWVHWILFNIPAKTNSLAQGPTHLPTDAFEGTNDFRKIGYGGPCPPGGMHTYQFKLYALDTTLTLKSGATKAELLMAMQGHILSKATLMAHYKRAGK